MELQRDRGSRERSVEAEALALRICRDVAIGGRRVVAEKGAGLVTLDNGRRAADAVRPTRANDDDPQGGCTPAHGAVRAVSALN